MTNVVQPSSAARSCTPSWPSRPGGDRAARGAVARGAQDPGEVAADERQPVDAVRGRLERVLDRAARLLDALADLRELVHAVVDLDGEDGEDGEQDEGEDVGGDRRAQGSRRGWVEAHAAPVPAGAMA